MIEKIVLNVFISSPGDVKQERQIASQVIGDINATGLAYDYQLTPYLYERTAPAVVGQPAQFIVNDYMVHPRDADIFVCFLWSRLGTPVKNHATGEEYQSGTEYEFLHAYQSYKERGRPKILLYQCTRAIAPDAIDLEQLGKVQSFFRAFYGEYSRFEGLYRSYVDEQEFARILQSDILTILHRDFPPAFLSTLTLGVHSKSIGPLISSDALRARCYDINTELRTYPTLLAEIHEIARTETARILDWIIANEDPKPLGMLIDKPGRGKTVVMAQVLKQLEARGVRVLALKSDYLSGIRSEDDLRVRLNLPVSVEECVRQLAAEEPVVVLIDQLDALSVALSQDFSALDYIYSLIIKLLRVSNVRVIVSCREFDLHFDPKLSSLNRQHYTTFTLSPLTKEQLDEALHVLGLDTRLTLSQRMYQLLAVPLHLSIFVRVMMTQETSTPLEEVFTLQQLYDHLWDKHVTASRIPNVSEAINVLIDAMQSAHHLTAPVGVLDHENYKQAAVHLQREHFIRKEKGNYVFFHQTLFDYCYARRFVAQGRSISEVIFTSAQGLFERAQMVQVLAYMRASNPAMYIGEMDTFLFNGRLRVHLRLLLIEWFAAIPNPFPEEHALVRRLIQTNQDRHDFLRASKGNVGWFDVLNRGYLSTLLAHENREGLTWATFQYLPSFMNRRTREVLALLAPYEGRSLTWDSIILRCLTNLTDWREDA